MVEVLRLIIRTPHEIIFDEAVRAARVPSENGQVGLRPRAEPSMLLVEPGLVVLRIGEGVRFAATAGGLIDSNRTTAVLFTPFAVVSDHGDEVLAALDRVLATPDTEIAARRRLGELEQHIVHELRQRPAIARGENA